MNALTFQHPRRRAGLRPKLWYSLPPRIRRALSTNTTQAARILEVEAIEELSSEAPDPGPEVELEQWDEEALLETFEEADPLGETSIPWDQDAEPQVVELRKPTRPDYARFADALRAKPRPAPEPKREVPVERARQDPGVGRQHTNGCFGARFDLRKKGLLVDCSQCDRALTRTEAAACRSPFCKANVAKVGFA